MQNKASKLTIWREQIWASFIPSGEMFSAQSVCSERLEEECSACKQMQARPFVTISPPSPSWCDERHAQHPVVHFSGSQLTRRSRTLHQRPARAIIRVHKLLRVDRRLQLTRTWGCTIISRLKAHFGTTKFPKRKRISTCNLSVMLCLADLKTSAQESEAESVSDWQLCWSSAV